MNRRNTLLLVGGLDRAVIEAKELGIDVILLQHPTKVTDEQRRHADVLHVVDYTDWEAVEPLVRALHRSPGFAEATSLTEPGLETAGRINDLLALGGTGYRVARRFRDKRAMRAHLARFDHATVGAAPVTGAESMVAFGARYGYPFVVKPADATASIGVRLVDSPDQVPQEWARLVALRGTRTDRVSSLFVLRDFMMEEYVEGPEFSVESFSFAGRHIVITVTEKLTTPDHFAELGHVVPARLPEHSAARIRAYVCWFLDVMGLRDGASHTELRLSDRGPRIIESHNRFGGDAIPDLVFAAFGVDLTRLAVGWPMHRVGALPYCPVPTRGAVSRFLVGRSGTVAAVGGVETARAQDGVLTVDVTARPGQEVFPLRDNWDRLGLVAVTGTDPDAALARAEDLVRETVAVDVFGHDGDIHRARLAPLAREAVGAA